METCTLSFQLPRDLVEYLGDGPELAAKAKEAFLMQLVREARISQGKAAEVLGITRYDALDLMVKYEVSSGPETAEDLRREVETAERLLKEARAVGGDQ